jgi:hypothetical protein
LARECQVVVGQYSIAIPRFTYLNRADVVLVNLRAAGQTCAIPGLVSKPTCGTGHSLPITPRYLPCIRRTVGTGRSYRCPSQTEALSGEQCSSGNRCEPVVLVSRRHKRSARPDAHEREDEEHGRPLENASPQMVAALNREAQGRWDDDGGAIPLDLDMQTTASEFVKDRRPRFRRRPATGRCFSTTLK